MDMKQAIAAVLDRRDLSGDEMQTVMSLIMTGEATPAQIGGFLIGLRMKGETVVEITAAAKVMRSLSTPVPVAKTHLVDTCGTGGDGSSTFNISTAAAFVAAAAGVKVAKHGNRSVSSKSGSADVLEAAGVRLDLMPEEVARSIDSTGIGFMFAPAHHGAMKHAIGPRKEMGVRTLFNLLGPLTNPAGAPNQVVGVFAKQWLRPVAEVLQALGSRHVLVVHSADGMDEISISDKTYVAELKDGAITEYSVMPEQFALPRAPIQELAVNSVEASLTKLKSSLSNGGGAATDIVILNAGAAIYVSGVATTLEEGVAMAQDAIGSGMAKEKLSEFSDFTILCKAE